MFKKVKANSIEEYISSIPTDRKEDILFLHNLIKNLTPNLKPHFAYNMLGYGSFKYKNNKTKQMLDWPVIGLANQKNYISLYVCATNNGKYIAEENKSRLGKVSVGKSCIRFKKLADVNLDELKKVIILASKNPGLFN